MVTQGITNAAHFAATNIGAFTSGDVATLGVNAAQFAAELLDKHRQIEELSMEVNDALQYIASVKKWTARAHGCETDRISAYVGQLETYISDNFLDSTSFLQRMVETDRRAMDILHVPRPKRWVQRVLADSFINLWPQFYRSDFIGRATRLVEMVEASMMEAQLSQGSPGSACAVHESHPRLQVGKSPR
jgi:hypothetical protein